MKNSLISQNKNKLVSFMDLGIDGFSYNGYYINPHIYIPYYPTATSSPNVVLNLNDDTLLPSWSKMNNVIQSKFIGETDARNKLTMVIAGNETVLHALDSLTIGNEFAVNDHEIQPLDIIQKVNEREIYINKLFIQNKKEAWGNGRGEVNFVVMHLFNYCGLNAQLQSNSTVRKVRNSDLNKWVSTVGDNGLSVPSPSDLYWNPLNELFGIVFYEKDVRKKFQRIYTPVSGCSERKIYTIDKEDEYFSYQFFGSQFPLTNNVTQYVNIPGAGGAIEVRYKTIN